MDLTFNYSYIVDIICNSPPIPGLQLQGMAWSKTGKLQGYMIKVHCHMPQMYLTSTNYLSAVSWKCKICGFSMICSHSLCTANKMASVPTLYEAIWQDFLCTISVAFFILSQWSALLYIVMRFSLAKGSGGEGVCTPLSTPPFSCYLNLNVQNYFYSHTTVSNLKLVSYSIRSHQGG